MKIKCILARRRHHDRRRWKWNHTALSPACLHAALVLFLVLCKSLYIHHLYLQEKKYYAFAFILPLPTRFFSFLFNLFLIYFLRLFHFAFYYLLLLLLVVSQLTYLLCCVYWKCLHITLKIANCWRTLIIDTIAVYYYYVRKWHCRKKDKHECNDWLSESY